MFVQQLRYFTAEGGVINQQRATPLTPLVLILTLAGFKERETTSGCDRHPYDRRQILTVSPEAVPH